MYYLSPQMVYVKLNTSCNKSEQVQKDARHSSSLVTAAFSNMYNQWKFSV